MLPLADSRDGTVYLVLDPLCVVAFNTADGWMRDVTADIAREVRFRGAGGRVRARPSPNANGDAIVSRHLRRQLRRRDASTAAPVHTPVPAMSRPSCVMGCRSHERTYRQARALRHLYAQIDRVQSRACLQLARRPTRGLRGLYKEPSARRLAVDPRLLRRWCILRCLARPPR